MAPDDQLRMFLEALDPALPAALDVRGARADRRRVPGADAAHRPDITPGAVEAVRELRARGLRLGLISNTGRTPGRVLRRLLEDADLLPCFDVLVFSDEARVRKPAAAIFRRVLDQTRVDPARAVHVGDDAVSDVAGARGAGMRAIHFVPDVLAAGAGRRRAAAVRGPARPRGPARTALTAARWPRSGRD